MPWHSACKCAKWVTLSITIQAHLEERDMWGNPEGLDSKLVSSTASDTRMPSPIPHHGLQTNIRFHRTVPPDELHSASSFALNIQYFECWCNLPIPLWALWPTQRSHCTVSVLTKWAVIQVILYLYVQRLTGTPNSPSCTPEYQCSKNRQHLHQLPMRFW